MAASWEQQPTVLCAFLHTDVTSIAWALGFRGLQINGPIMPIAGVPFDHGRNLACMKALEIGVDYLFFIDSDIVAPPDTIRRLVSHGKGITSGLYHRRSPPAGVPVMQRPPGQWITTYPKNALIEVDVVGAGCLLIRRDVLETLPPQRPGHHWFWWAVDQQGLTQPNEAPPMSEDFTFNIHARKHGFPSYVDTSVQCRHLGLAEAGYASFKPAECIPA